MNYTSEVTEDYVSFEIAKLLKEKGFDEKCHSAWLYNPRKDNSEYFVEYLAKDTENNTELGYFNEPDTDWAYSAPTLNIALKWLREVHGIIPIILTGDSSKNPLYYWFRIDKFVSGKLEYSTYREGKLEFKTYEEACEASIKYCLENLI